VEVKPLILPISVKLTYKSNMIVNLPDEHCDKCGEKMKLTPGKGDGHTTAAGRPYDWLCSNNHRKFARHLNDEEAKAINAGANPLAEIEEKNGKSLADMQDDERAKAIIQKTEAEHALALQRQRQFGRVEGVRVAYAGLISDAEKAGKRTVKLGELRDRLKKTEALIKGHSQ